MKKFKTRKKNIRQIVLFLGLFLVSVAFSIKYLLQNEMVNDNTIIELLLNDFTLKDKEKKNNVDFLLKYALNIGLDKKSEVKEAFLETDEEPLKSEPIVYIYNTHQTEKYKSSYLEVYNIDSNVLIAAKILKEYLENLGIKTIVEEEDVAKKLHSLGWKYGSSYKVSRIFMENAKIKYPSLTYFIDLHRDSSNYDKTTVEINGKSYAKLLFVVGLDNKNYEDNLETINRLAEIIKNNNNEIYRGIIKKSGKGVNGVYNQDFNPNTMLIEVGGQYNNISEVNNTLQLLAENLKEFIKGDLNE